jgi:hypothetical protein
VQPGDVERRARHLAAAASSAAESATRRGGAVAAVAWLTRAAELSQTPADRSRRLGDAAFIAGHAALLDQAQRLVRADPAPGPAGSPATAITAAYVALYEDGDVRSAHHRVAAAIENLRDDSPEVLTRLVDLLLATSLYAGDAVSWHRTEQLLRSLGDRVHPRSAVYRDAWSDVVRHGRGVPERVERAFADVSALEPWADTSTR